MNAYEIGAILAERAATGQRWLEFLRVADLSMGVYVLTAGDTDPQKPHSEDEVYYILAGKGSIRVADEVRPVMTGSVVYVAKGVDHRFIDITEQLEVLVFFAPAEGSKK